MVKEEQTKPVTGRIALAAIDVLKVGSKQTVEMPDPLKQRIFCANHENSQRLEPFAMSRKQVIQVSCAPGNRTVPLDVGTDHLRVKES
jgi:hypothetical protein